MKALSILLLLLLTFGSCKKKSKKWLTGEFQVVDAITKVPVKARIELEYYAGSLFGSQKEYIDLGITDEKGRFQLSRRVNKKDSGFILNIRGIGYYGPYQSYDPHATLSISNYSHNIRTIELAPFYHMTLTLNNINCFDQTDSVWIGRIANTHPDNARIYTGCLDDFIPLEVFYWSIEKHVTFYSISKKNGIYDTLSHDYSLVANKINNNVLNY